MARALTSVSVGTPQTQPADVRQVQNSAGGFVFQIDPSAQVRRFLMLGTDGGTFYAAERDLTISNAKVVIEVARKSPADLLLAIRDVNDRNAAPRHQPLLFALAVAASVGDEETRAAALRMVPDVVRTGTHLFTFLRYISTGRGWGRGLRRAVSDWYLGKDPDRIAYQVIKYRQRETWTHRDVLRSAHPKTTDPAMRALFDWLCRRPVSDALPGIVEGYLRAQERGADIPALVRQYRLPWEALPDAAMNQAETWDALLDVGLPVGALLRQLPRLTRLGLLPAMGGRTAEVTGRLTDSETLRRGRIHPVSVLVAGSEYGKGHARSGGEFVPTRQVVDALDAAFYAAYGSVPVSGKRTRLALDVSPSMTHGAAGGLPLTARQASAALALVTANVEPQYDVVGFASGVRRGQSKGGLIPGLVPLGISPRQRLNDAMAATERVNWAGTDCSLPIVDALQRRIEFDTFVVYCVDEATEILTADGWRTYDRLQPGEEVYTLDHATGVAGWEPVSAVNVFPETTRRMLRMEGRSHSSLSTLNHRWPVCHYGAAGRGRRWKTSETLNTGDYLQTAARDGSLPTEPKFSDAFVELLAWSWTEGHLGDSGGLTIVQSHGVHSAFCERIDAALTAYVGPEHDGDMRQVRTAAVRSKSGTTRPPTPAWRRSSRGRMTEWRLNAAAAAPLREWMDADKVVDPRFYRLLTPAQLDLFVSTSLEADGSASSGSARRNRLGQRSRARAESFQVACVMAGHSTSLLDSPDGGAEVGLLRRREFSPIRSATNSDGRPFVAEEVDHDGIVWCPTTPSGTWLARRNGTVYWTGNTDNETWSGSIHPHEALARYRQASGIDARLVVVGMTSTGFSVADPTDPGMLDVVGFDGSVPALISEFSSRGV